MTKPGPSVTSGADTQPGSDSLFPSGFGGGGASVRAGGVGTTEIADGSVAAADLNLANVAAAIAARSELTGTYAPIAAAYRPTARVPARRSSTVVANFGTTGHGFTANAGAQNVNLNDISTYCRGTQSITWQTKGAGATASVNKTGISSINATGKRFELSLKIDDWTHLSNIYLYVGDGSFTNFYVLQVWPASSGTPPVDGGTWANYTVDLSSISSTTGTPNWGAITAIQVTLQDDGTGNPVTGHINHIGITPNSATYPNGVVSLTFDDSFQSQFDICRPKLEQYGYQGTFYTIADAIGGNNYYMTLPELRQMNDLGGHEIAPHAYLTANHNLTNGFKDLTSAQLDAELYQLKQWMVANRFSGADHFCWPKGLHSDSADAIAAKYFASARVTQRFPVEHTIPADPMRLRAYGAQTPVTLAQAKATVDKALANGSWQILIFHDVVASPPTPPGTTLVQWDTTSFNSLIDYINAQGVTVKTVGDVLKTAAS